MISIVLSRYLFNRNLRKLIFAIIVIFFVIQYFKVVYKMNIQTNYSKITTIDLRYDHNRSVKLDEQVTANALQGYQFGSEKNPVSLEYIKELDKTLLDPHNKTKIPFLSNYQNPCWYSELPKSVSTMYEDNLFMELSDKEPDDWLIDLGKLRSEIIKSKKNTHFKCLPHVYLLGLPKCGTTDIYYKLIKHHQIFGGMKKEYHWWNKGRYGLRFPADHKIISLQHYIELFDSAANNIKNSCPGVKEEQDYHPCVSIDASVSTFWFTTERLTSEDGKVIPPEPADMLPAIMYRLQPNAKLMVILRNPISRCYSDYFFFNKNKTKDPEKFHKVALETLKLYKECIAINGPRDCTYNKTLQKQMSVRFHISMYYIYMKDWLAIWPKEQLFVIKMEEYSSNNTAALKQITDYLDLDPFHDNMLSKVVMKPPGIGNVAPKGGEIWQETKELLTEFFQPYNDKLATLLNSETFRWVD